MPPDDMQPVRSGLLSESAGREGCDENYRQWGADRGRAWRYTNRSVTFARKVVGMIRLYRTEKPMLVPADTLEKGVWACLTAPVKVQLNLNACLLRVAFHLGNSCHLTPPHGTIPRCSSSYHPDSLIFLIHPVPQSASSSNRTAMELACAVSCSAFANVSISWCTFRRASSE